ncbi:MAG: hypothetical protein HWE39_12090 [Oceanospirillaceae bacterium]|nr:hypothetical protein [Oceanospirillaceae bacterium]
MDKMLSSHDKFDLQQNYRRYLKFRDQMEDAMRDMQTAKASRVWVAGVVALLFALASDFFLGAAAALFGMYFYRLMVARMQSGKAEEGCEDTDRWFAAKGLKFEGRILYFRDDKMLENPLDPFDDAIYG